MHGLEVFSDGTGSMFSARQTPWHMLGVVTPGAVDAMDAMKLARLDWEVTKHPVYAHVTETVGINLDGTDYRETTQVEIDGKFTTMRRHPETGLWNPLGVVGNDYTVVQNIDWAELLNTISNQSGATFETAGSLNNGKQAFVTMELPENILVGGVDVVKMYLIGVMSHDGRSKNRVLISPTRVVCRNTLTAAMRDCVSSVEISHTSGVKEAMEQARRVLGVSFKAAEEFSVIAEQLIGQKFTTNEFDALVDALWEPKKDKAGEATQTTTVRKDKLFGLWSDAETQEDGRGTKWAAFNAVAEYMDWFAPMKKENATGRATRIATGMHTVEAPKTKALTLLGV